MFPQAAAVVSTAGAGTISQGLRAGRPLVMVPYGNDQPDNAARVERLGISRTIPRARYDRATAAAALQDLLSTPSVAARAEACAVAVAGEEGVKSAVSALTRSFP